jgi:hypothetical protein
LDEKVVTIAERTLDKLDNLGVGWDPKTLKKRKLMLMLNDIEKMNGSVSNMIIRRFNLEMTLRREKLAFAMDKKYHLRRFQPGVYNTLAEGTMLDSKLKRPLTSGIVDGVGRSSQRNNHSMTMRGKDLVISPILKKELG